MSMIFAYIYNYFYPPLPAAVHIYINILYYVTFGPILTFFFIVNPNNWMSAFQGLCSSVLCVSRNIMYLVHNLPYALISIYDFLCYYTVANIWRRFIASWNCPQPTTFMFMRTQQNSYCELYNWYHATPTRFGDFDCYLIALILALGFILIFYVTMVISYGITSFKFWFQHQASCITHFGSRQMSHDRNSMKQLFEQTNLPISKQSENHSHPISASLRNAATVFARTFMVSSGFTPYSVQQSVSDQTRNIAGSRSFFWGKDTIMRPLNDRILPEHGCYLIDVDYYVDMPNFLALNNDNPIIVYSFQPSSVGKSAPEYSYSFTDNVVKMIFTGGGTFMHEIWNYQLDTIKVSQTIFGIPIRTKLFTVTRKYIDEDHELILLIPIRSWRFPFTLPALFIAEAPLTRLRVSQGLFSVLKSQTREGSFTSVAQVGSTTSCSVPDKILDEILTASKLTKIAIQHPTVAHVLTTNGIKDSYVSKLLTLYALHKTEGPVATTYPVPMTIHFTHVTKNFLQDTKPCMTAFSNPFCLTAFTPTECRGNEEAMVINRVTKFEEFQNTPMSSFLMEAIADFVALVVPVPFHGEPATYDDVWDKQSRPMQRHTFVSTQFDESVAKFKTFMKKEPYGKFTDPRNITTIDGKTKVEYSTYFYAVSRHLSTFDWYAFGRTPSEVADLVVALALNAESLTGTDGSRWDGHISYVLRFMERAFLLRFFNPIYHDAVIKLHDKQFNAKAKTRFGVAYETGPTRGSGTPETTGFNGLGNKFIAFIAALINEVEGSRVPAAIAFQHPCIVGGDDGLVADMPPETLARAARMVGQVYENEIFNKGGVVKFLARTYMPEVWFGRRDSVCDIDRSLRKFHLTVRVPLSNEEKLIEKSRSYFLSDARTPLIGHIVSKVIEIYGFSAAQELHNEKELDTNMIARFDAHHQPEEQYPNDINESDWPHCEMPETIDIDGFIDAINNCKTLTDILAFPMFDTRPVPVPPSHIVTDGGLAFFTEVPEQLPTKLGKNHGGWVEEIMDAYNKDKINITEPRTPLTTDTTTTQTLTEQHGDLFATLPSPPPLPVAKPLTNFQVVTNPNSTKPSWPHPDAEPVKIRLIIPSEQTVPESKLRSLPRNHKNRDKLFHFNRVLFALSPDYNFPTMLDFGAGDCVVGMAVAALTKSKLSVYDPMNPNCAIASVKFNLINVEHFNEEMEPFDLILISQVFHHVSNKQGFFIKLKNASRVGTSVLLREHDFKDEKTTASIIAQHKELYDDETVHSKLSRGALIEMFAGEGFSFDSKFSSNYPKDKNPYAIYTIGFSYTGEPRQRGRQIRLHDDI